MNWSGVGLAVGQGRVETQHVRRPSSVELPVSDVVVLVGWLSPMFDTPCRVAIVSSGRR